MIPPVATKMKAIQNVLTIASPRVLLTSEEPRSFFCDELSVVFHAPLIDWISLYGGFWRNRFDLVPVGNGAHRQDQMRDRDDNDAADEEGKGEQSAVGAMISIARISSFWQVRIIDRPQMPAYPARAELIAATEKAIKRAFAIKANSFD